MTLILALSCACSSEALNAEGGAGEASGPEQPAGPGPVLAASARLFPEGASAKVLYKPTNRRSATALAFNPQVPGELWVVLRQFPVDAPCTSKVSTGCNALRGQVAVISDAHTDDPVAVIKEDGNSWHFMRRPTCIAFGDNGNFATCAEARTGNYEDETALDYVGPTLWSSSPTIFGVEPKPGQNGTHLDMLHLTPFCMGIAHEIDNAYFTFNGQIGSIDRYDFKLPHEIGGEDHTDGEFRRYVTGELARVAEVPSHLVLDKARRLLYIADTGNSRVVRLDIDSGRVGGEVAQYDGLAVSERIDDATLDTFIPEGELALPSGIALHGTLVLVGDNADGVIHAYDSSDGREITSFSTGLAEGALGGLAVGPDERLYFTNLASGEVLRVQGP